MAEAYIVAAARTAGGRKGGRLAGWHPADLAASVLDALVERSRRRSRPDRGRDHGLRDAGRRTVQQHRAQRHHGLETAGERARHLDRPAMRLVAAGAAFRRASGDVRHHGLRDRRRRRIDDAGADGPRLACCRPRTASATYKSPNIEKRYPNIVFSQFTGAEMMAEKYGLSKDELDEYSYQSHQRAIAATQAGKFKDEIIPLQITRADGSTDTHTIDEGIRFDVSLDGIKGVKLIAENGKLTAASSSQICDGASGVVVVNERGLKSLGVKPMARIHHMTMMGGDPVIMLDAPLHATERALKKAGMSIDDIDLFEVNEAFASVPTAWLKTTGADPAQAQRQRRRDRARPSARRLRHQADDHAGQRAQAAQQALRPADHVRRRRHGQCDDRGAAVRTATNSASERE